MKFQGGIGRISSVLLYILTCQYTQAGPVIRPSRMVREIYPEVEQEIPDSSQPQACIVGDSTYPPLAPIPSTTPCLKCSCQWGEVRCEAEACAPPPGCRAVSRPGRCCPAYECECAHQGRVYANGERLPQEEGKECSVCYCRGGHVQCAEVGCYTRSDCEARFVRGQCCPKYEHCPPRDPLSDRITITSPPPSSPSASLDLDLLSPWSQGKDNTTGLALSSNSAYEGSGDDEVAMSDEPKRASTPVTFSIKEIESKGGKRQEDNVKVVKVDKSTQTSPLNPQITIQEVIPPRTEFVPQVSHLAVSVSPVNPATYKAQAAMAPTLSSNEVADEAVGSDDSGAVDSESYASEKTEVYDHPPPVLRIGDQLLFVKQGQLVPEKDASTPSPVITLIGAEGLQIGLGSGELIDHEILPSAEISTSDASVEKSSSESSEENSTTKTTDDVTTIETNETTENEREFIAVSSTDSSTDITSKESSVSTLSSTASSTPSSVSSSASSSAPSSTSSSTAAVEVEQSEYIPEENPYYPPIPEDIMNLSQDEITTDVTVKTSKKIVTSTEADLSTLSVLPLSRKTVVPLAKKVDEPKILPTVLELRNNDTINTTSAQEWLKTEEPTKITIPLLNEKAALPDSILDMVAASDFNNEEDTFTTTVATTQKLNKIMAGTIETPADKSKETLELNEELFDSVEYTTIPPVHSSLISSEDASVEMIQNDSAPIDTSDLVEMVPGFETTNPPKHESELKSIHKSVDGVSGPKAEVEMIHVSEETQTHVEMKDFHEEIQKRDVVKKVLKDTFENPKENIQTDVVEPISAEISQENEEQNVVKPNLSFDNSTKIKETTTSQRTTTETSRQYHNSKLAD